MRMRQLFSYWFFKDKNLEKLFSKYDCRDRLETFIDSGAFNAFSIGAQVDISDYMRWLRENQSVIDLYANLDVIGSSEKTLENQRRLEDAGFLPIPVFHVGEDWSYLEYYIENYGYVALGGMVPYLRFPKKLMPWLIRCFKMAKGRTVFHGFGATSWKIIRDLPWYSVDSSSWGSGFRYGRVSVFDPNRSRFTAFSLRDEKTIGKAAGLIRYYGLEPKDFLLRDRYHRHKVYLAASLSYMKAEEFLRNRWGVEYNGDKGLKIFLVSGSFESLEACDLILRNNIARSVYENIG